LESVVDLLLAVHVQVELVVFSVLLEDVFLQLVDGARLDGQLALGVAEALLESLDALLVVLLGGPELA